MQIIVGDSNKTIHVSTCLGLCHEFVRGAAEIRINQKEYGRGRLRSSRRYEVSNRLYF